MALFIQPPSVRDAQAVHAAAQGIGVDAQTHGAPVLAMAILAGVNCPVVDAAQVRDTVLAADLALGRDQYARRYLTSWRHRSTG